MQPLHQFLHKPLRTPRLRILTRIMILDDDEIDRMVCTRIINRAEISKNLVNFTAPDAALAYFADPASPPVDLILLDVNMPCMNGFEFLEAAQKLIALPCVPPVLIMLSAPLGPLHRDHAKKLSGIKGYLDKPFSADDLTLAIRAL